MRTWCLSSHLHNHHSALYHTCQYPNANYFTVSHINMDGGVLKGVISSCRQIRVLRIACGLGANWLGHDGYAAVRPCVGEPVLARLSGKPDHIFDKSCRAKGNRASCYGRRGRSQGNLSFDRADPQREYQLRRRRHRRCGEQWRGAFRGLRRCARGGNLQRRGHSDAVTGAKLVPLLALRGERCQ